MSIRKPDGEPVDAGSILAVLTLNVAHGDEVVLSTEDGADATLDQLVELLRQAH